MCWVFQNLLDVTFPEAVSSSFLVIGLFLCIYDMLVRYCHVFYCLYYCVASEAHARDDDGVDLGHDRAPLEAHHDADGHVWRLGLALHHRGTSFLHIKNLFIVMSCFSIVLCEISSVIFTKEHKISGYDRSRYRS